MVGVGRGFTADPPAPTSSGRAGFQMAERFLPISGSYEIGTDLEDRGMNAPIVNASELGEALLCRLDRFLGTRCRMGDDR